MPRPPRRLDTSGADLRAHLLTEAIELRDLVCAPGREPIDGRPPAVADPEFFAAMAGELDKPVQALASGGEYRLRRNDLPDWHGDRFAGDPNDEFELGADDVLRVA